MKVALLTFTQALFMKRKRNGNVLWYENIYQSYVCLNQKYDNILFPRSPQIRNIIKDYYYEFITEFESNFYILKGKLSTSVQVCWYKYILWTNLKSVLRSTHKTEKFNLITPKTGSRQRFISLSKIWNTLGNRTGGTIISTYTHIIIVAWQPKK